jgi:hypothetical protein
LPGILKSETSGQSRRLENYEPLKAVGALRAESHAPKKSENHLPFSILKKRDWGTGLKADTEFKPNAPSSVTPNGKWKIKNGKLFPKPIPILIANKYTLPELSNSMSLPAEPGVYLKAN